jgi:hypothetical protein
MKLFDIVDIIFYVVLCQSVISINRYFEYKHCSELTNTISDVLAVVSTIEIL